MISSDIILSIPLMLFIFGIFVSFIVSMGLFQADEYAERELKVQQLREKEENEVTATNTGTDRSEEAR